jgi:integrase
VRTPYIYDENELKTIRRLIWELDLNAFRRHRNVLIFDMIRILGIRPTDACRSRLDEIDWITGIWRISPDREKTRTEKIFYLAQARILWKHLSWYRRTFADLLDRDGFLFPTRKRGIPYGPGHFEAEVWKKAVPQGSLHKKTWRGRNLYDLRATKFTRAFRSGSSMNDILSLGQWSNPQTPWRYYILAAQEDAQARLLA